MALAICKYLKKRAGLVYALVVCGTCTVSGFQQVDGQNRCVYIWRKCHDSLVEPTDNFACADCLLARARVCKELDLDITAGFCIHPTYRQTLPDYAAMQAKAKLVAATIPSGGVIPLGIFGGGLPPDWVYLAAYLPPPVPKPKPAVWAPVSATEPPRPVDPNIPYGRRLKSRS